MAITLNPNEKLVCVCLCPNCGGGMTAYNSRRWIATATSAHCANQQSGCGFATGQETSFVVY